MLKKLSTIFVVVLFAMGVVFAQQAVKKAPVQFNEPAAVAHTVKNIPGPQTMSPTAANWKLVDSMANIYGPAISTINPLAYDPYVNVAGFFHRGMSSYGPGSGALFYNVTTNGGASWSRVNGPVNAGTQASLAGRYPSMAILNPTNSTTLSDAYGVFAWPALASSFDYCGFAADAPLGGASYVAGLMDHDGAYSSQTPVWTSGDYALWTAEYSTANSTNPGWQGRLFRTADFATIDSLVPPFFDKTTDFTGLITLGGASRGNTTYVGLLGTFTSPTGNTIASGWFPAVSKSTDKGATWSAEEVIDFRTIPALNRFDRLHDYKKGDDFVSYCGDINVDGDGYPHLVLVLTDTTVDANSGNNSVVELYKTASGWNGKIVFNGISDSSFTKFAAVDPALGQMGTSPYLATDKTGNYFVCQWVNPTSTTDSICDIYYATRTKTGDWSTATNITSTTNLNEDASHLAPYMGGTAPNFTFYTMYAYEKGNNTYQITQTAVGNVYCAAVPVVINGVEDVNAKATSFTLQQNYPNPFNPSTNITFTLNERANVSLKVYDLMGREVATLINGVKEAGTQNVVFNASNLASGVYVYTLKAGTSTITKKMTLLK